jgi:predicted hydrocarbon binding protein
MPKKSKKPNQVMIDEKRGHLFFGKDLRVLMLRPIDLIEFSEFAGSNSDDIVIWVGKTIGKYFTEKLFANENWSDLSLSSKKMFINEVLENLELLGYGRLTSIFKKDRIFVHVNNPVSFEEKENIMAKNICLFYQGIFHGLLEQVEIDVDGKEVSCCLLEDEECTFRYKLLVEEFKDEDVDEERKQEEISEFLSSL